jgi:hypothetical protein
VGEVLGPGMGRSQADQPQGGELGLDLIQLGGIGDVEPVSQEAVLGIEVGVGAAHWR